MSESFGRRTISTGRLTVLRIVVHNARWRAAYALLEVGAALAVCIVIFSAAPALKAEFGPLLSLSLCCVGVALANALALAIHEAGHVLGGAYVGLAPETVHIGPITFARRAGFWSARWDWSRPLLGGWVSCALPAENRWRVVVFVLAGPLANLVLGFIAVWGAIRELPALASCWVGLIAVQSLFLGALSLVPMRAGELDSDGLALYRLLRANNSTTG